MIGTCARAIAVLLATVSMVACTRSYFVRPEHLARAGGRWSSPRGELRVRGDARIAALTDDREPTFLRVDRVVALEGMTALALGDRATTTLVDLLRVSAVDHRLAMRIAGVVLTAIATLMGVAAAVSWEPDCEGFIVSCNLGAGYAAIGAAAVGLAGVPFVLIGFLPSGSEVSAGSRGMPSRVERAR